MCADYIGAGLPPERFWDITPRLYIIELRGARKRLEREQSERVEAAWITAALTRSAKLPKLDKLLGIKARPRRPEEVKAQLAAISSVLPKITLAEWRARKSRP